MGFTCILGDTFLIVTSILGDTWKATDDSFSFILEHASDVLTISNCLLGCILDFFGDPILDEAKDDFSNIILL